MPTGQADGLSLPPRLVAKCLLCAQDMYRHPWRDRLSPEERQEAPDLDKRETRGRVEAVPALGKCLWAFI